jgi:RNA-binding protein YlmH
MAMFHNANLVTKHFFVTLPSNTPINGDQNKSAKYKVVQPNVIELAVQNWEVGIVEVFIQNKFAEGITAESVGLIYAYLDIISEQRVGNVLAKLARIINIADAGGYNIFHHEFNKVHYYPLSLGRIDSIGVMLTTSSGELVRFADDTQVSLVLEFRPKRGF